MTTGSSQSGGYPPSASNKFYYRKDWSGADGRTIAGRVSRKPKWNAYSMTKTSYIGGNPTIVRVKARTGPTLDPLRTNHSYTSALAIPVFSTDWTVQDEYRLLAKLLSRVKGHSFHAGVALAEVDKFAGTALSAIKDIGLGALDLFQGRFASFARRFGANPPGESVSRALRARDLSGRFLEMRYAWEPTISDVFSASQAFEALSNGPRQVVYRATRRKQIKVYYPTNYGRVLVLKDYRRTYTYEAYEELGAFRQMGLVDPASIIWERIPYSFVIDWFIPIGTYLELIGQIPFLKGRFMRGDLSLATFSGKVLDDPANGYAIVGPEIPDLQYRYAKYDRTLPSSLTVPRPTLQVAGAVHGRRIANAIALSHQIFNRLLAAGVNRYARRNQLPPSLSGAYSLYDSVS